MQPSRPSRCHSFKFLDPRASTLLATHHSPLASHPSTHPPAYPEPLLPLRRGPVPLCSQAPLELEAHRRPRILPIARPGRGALSAGRGRVVFPGGIGRGRARECVSPGKASPMAMLTHLEGASPRGGCSPVDYPERLAPVVGRVLGAAGPRISAAGSFLRVGAGARARGSRAPAARREAPGLTRGERTARVARGRRGRRRPRCRRPRRPRPRRCHRSRRRRRRRRRRGGGDPTRVSLSGCA
jgi:hypothetical protein